MEEHHLLRAEAGAEDHAQVRWDGKIRGDTMLRSCQVYSREPEDNFNSGVSGQRQDQG